jgi:glycosyltransferase involved in cell wall biosynthesis
MMSLSFYVLTYNSEKYLKTILEKIKNVADEIIVVDSGSTDSTEEIALSYTDLFFVRTFDNFVNQRSYAIEKCSYEWIFFLDSDEIPNNDLIERLKYLKKEEFEFSSGIEAYQIPRFWYVLGRRIHSVYPVCSPDYPIRIFRKSKATYKTSSLVHETIGGFNRFNIIKGGYIDHHTFETKEEIEEKLEKYTSLAAIDAKNKGKKGNRFNALIHASAAFIRWYFLKGAYKDGKVGVKMGQYAYLYTYYKYIKLTHLGQSPPPDSRIH